MKVIGINGSARKDGNTAIIIQTIFEKLQENEIETELIQLPDLHIEPCRLCDGRECLVCLKKGSCIFINDDFYIVYEKIKEADGLILGSPVYGADVTTKMKTFIDRLGISSLGDPDVLRRKPGAAVAAVRRAGGMTTVDTLNHFMLFREMLVVGSTYWNMVYGKDAGDVRDDDEGMANMRNIGENMAWLLKKLHSEQGK
ncbi:MAG TPA: flavodoxin family protein [Candidatus Coprocola pullicola]|nr:flavodoxin family protein [Candidatus Coprocola pullicola]